MTIRDKRQSEFAKIWLLKGNVISLSYENRYSP
jgi:hypothetical protein